MIDFEERIKNLKEYMEYAHVDLCFLPKSSELEYLTGIPKGRYGPTYTNSYGDWAYGVFIFQDKIYCFIPEMLEKLGEAKRDMNKVIDEYSTIIEGKPIEDTMLKSIGERLKKVRKIAVTKNTYSTTIINLKKMIPAVEFVTLEEYMNNQRKIKTNYELSKMRDAAEITDRIFSRIVSMLRVGMTEIDIKTEIEHQVLLEECEGTSFHTGVMVYGKKSRPHVGGATMNKVLQGTTLAFDFGVIKDGFCSDFGRTVYVGDPTEEMIIIHETVMNAQKYAIEAMIPGKITCEELDMLARKYITECGYGQYFLHRLGHSIGRDVHEYPYLMSGYTETLRKNMTFTIEPSIFIDNKLLIRVEDVVAVGENGGEPLNKFTKDIIAI